MSVQMAICLIISLITVIGYLSNRMPMGIVAMISLLCFYATGCISAKDAVSYFGNQNLWLCVCMFICSAGFMKTQFVKKLARKVNTLAKGSLARIFFGYMLLGIILCQFIGQAVAEFSIVAPLLGASVDEIGEKRSKVMYPLVVMLLATMTWMPFGASYAFPMQVNSLFEQFGISDTITVMDNFILRAPSVIVLGIYMMTIGLKISPKEPLVPISDAQTVKTSDAKPLPPFQEKCGYVIFFATCILLLFCGKFGIAPWIITLAGAVAMVATGVLHGKEINNALPVSYFAVFSGALSMGGALTNTGAADLIGNFIANIAFKVNNTFFVYGAIFVVLFLVTQFMLNSAVIWSLMPVILSTAKVMGFNPVGAAVLVWLAATSAYSTPMSCPAIPLAMAAGGYDFKSVFKQSVIPSLIMGIVGVIWIGISYPIF